MRIDPTKFFVLASAIAVGACSSGDGSDPSADPNSGNGGTTGGKVDNPNGCDDSVGNPMDCASMIGGECGEFARDFCEVAKASLKPHLAEYAVECMYRGLQNGDNTCMGGPYDCVKEALGGACPDGTADGPCATYTTACSVSSDECHAYLDGLNAEGRAHVAECATGANACNYGLWSCIETLPAPITCLGDGPFEWTGDECRTVSVGYEQDLCIAAMYYLKPLVAGSAVVCMEEGRDDAYGCLRKAMDLACDDDALEGPCQQMATKCTGESIDTCHNTLKGLNEDGIARVQACVDAENCQFGIWSCVETLEAP